MSDDNKQAQDSYKELSDADIRLAESHRGFVREMDQSLGNAYGRGGGLVLVVFGAAVGLAAFQGWLTEVTMWLATVTATLFSLYLVRKRIYARRDRLRHRVDKYCEVNGLSPGVLTAYYDGQDMYPFFLAMYEDRRTPPGHSLAAHNPPTNLDPS